MSLALVNVAPQSAHKAEVTLTGTQLELTSPAATQLALQEAAKLGMNRPGINNAPGAYPVDNDGNSNEDVIMGRAEIAGYRRTFQVSGMP